MPESVIEVRDVSRRFGSTEALRGVSLTVERGSVFGLVGENGAGKTTLIRHLLGLLRTQTGSVSVFGLNPVEDPVGVLGRIGYLSEERDLPDWMRVSQLLNYTEAFYPKWDADFAAQLQEIFELDPQQRIRRLSRGQRARAGLLVALAHRPDLLLLDEPSSGLDPIVRRDILGAIIRTVSEEGRTVVFSSHLLEEVERVADTVAIIDHGRCVLCEPLEQVLSSHCCLTVRFEAALDAAPDLPGALLTRGEGREWTIVCNGQVDGLKAAAQKAGAEIVDQRAPSLEEVFIARAAR